MPINKTEIQRKIEINNFYKNLEANGLPLNFFEILETNGLTLEFLKILTETNTGKRMLEEMVNGLRRNYFSERTKWLNFYNEFFPESMTNEGVLSVRIDQTRLVHSQALSLLIVITNITTLMLMLENNLGLPFRFKVEKGEDYNLCEEPERKGTYAAWTPGQSCSKEASAIRLDALNNDPILKQIVLDNNIRVCSLKELLLRNMFEKFKNGKPIDQGKVITRTMLLQHDQPKKLVGIDFEKKSYFLINPDVKNQKEAKKIFFCSID
ncbi:hypothetical protein IPN41_00555 [Candidatus Falkowbacteria bacterium]|nr:MAG: hypothetical protein IPN41_00555 [Candidatus Falkowbacteria bacterium]